MAQLEPCPTCSRHVRVASDACPFCGAALSDTFRGTRRRPAAGSRLGRAALFAVGAALSTTSAGCYVSHEVDRDDAAPVDAAVRSDAGLRVDASVPRDAGVDLGSGMALYGDPPSPVEEPDAGEDVDLGAVSADYGSPPGR